MLKDQNVLTAEEQAAYLATIRRGYELIERDRRRSWQPRSDAQKESFDRLMQESLRHRKSNRTCGMTEWYAALLRGKHERRL